MSLADNNQARDTSAASPQADRISPHEKARLTLVVALVLLALSGLGAGVALVRFYLSESWVRHTYTVEVALGDLEAALSSVGRGRIAYVESPNPRNLQNFNEALKAVQSALANVRSLTNDNPSEQSLGNLLQTNVERRIAPSRESVELAEQNRSESLKQMQLTSGVAAAAVETASIVQDMRNNEDALLEQRSHLTTRFFGITVGILIVSFTLSAIMFWIHNTQLQRELRERQLAEQQSRQLSVQLLKVRDIEARRFARELHDSLGQSLVAAKMIADSLVSGNPDNQKFAELASLVKDAASQTRTISYLLHPPMLDDLGFASASDWFIEGFTQRTGIAVATNIASVSLPKDLELALFRILQEALTNIHRHSKSAKAEVNISVRTREVALTIRDYGMGIPYETLTSFRTKGTHVGVGLAGMKERLNEFKGELEIKSDGSGTTIIARIPLDVSPRVSVESLA